MVPVFARICHGSVYLRKSPLDLIYIQRTKEERPFESQGLPEELAGAIGRSGLCNLIALF
jgi:hypothetical protein